MLGGLLFLFIVFLVVFTPIGRFIATNLHNFIYYSPKDIYHYIKYKKYNVCPNYGYIRIFNGYFGSGKSLSMVDECISIYHRYNKRLIWSDDFQDFIEQKITIISNLELFGVPYVPFESEQQFITYEAEPGEVLLFLIDEIGTVWNNRDFKNFNPDVFNNIVQSRKRKMAIYGTLPVLAGTDINIRRYTDEVCFCSKWWRVIKHRFYKAADLENCANVDMLQPLRIEYSFVLDRMYNQYDTYAMVEKLKTDMSLDKFLTFNDLNVVNSDGDFKQAKLKTKYRKRQQ